MTVKNLHKVDGYWFWEHRGSKYRTNSEGEGIWEFDKRYHNWRQTIGTCDFSTVGIKPASVRAKLNRWFY